MSEEILRALMQLFAIIAKQDDGVNDAKRAYVDTFLKEQLSLDLVPEYVELFNKYAKVKSKRAGDKLTSVGDSVRTLGICKKINKTLDQKQKVVVLVRLFELINADGNFSDQRLEIIDTVSKVFKVRGEEFGNIEYFIKNLDIPANPSFLIASNSGTTTEGAKFIDILQIDSPIIVLYVASVNLYFVKYEGGEDVQMNGLSLKSDRVYLFANGSSINPPKSKTIYYSDVAARFLMDEIDVKLSFEVENVSLRFKNGNLGLRNISLSEQAGTLIGIMGASGAGKTTLLSVLSGMYSPTEGQVLINDTNLHTEGDKLEGIIGMVPQDDLLIEELTVYQNLFYNAKLCFKDKSSKELEELVTVVLDNLGLAHVGHLKVGNPLQKTISGGQRKRLNIGLELIREPGVLFLDEPTSGLSSKDSENVMDLLRELTLKGKLIFVVIHQPSSDIYKAFDKIIFLDTGGFLIYNGNPIEAITYFKGLDNQINADVGQCKTCGNVNPETVFNIVEAKVVDEFGQLTNKRKVNPPSWSGFYEERKDEVKVEKVTGRVKSSLEVPSKLKQFAVFLTRDFKAKISNKQYILLNLLEVPVLALFLSFIIRYIKDPHSDIYVFRENENLPAYILMCIVVSLFIGLTVSAEEIFKDRKILKRESFLNLSWLSYLFSKVWLLFVLSAVQSAMLVLIGNSIMGIQGMYLQYWFILFSISCFANVLGLNISASFNSAVTIYIIIPLLIIPQMILAGAMFSFDKLNKYVGGGYHVPIVAEVVPARWAYEGMMVENFVHNEYNDIFFEYDKRLSHFDYKMTHYHGDGIKKKLEFLADSADSKNPETIAEYEATITLLGKEFHREAVESKIQDPLVGAVIRLNKERDVSPENLAELKEYSHMLSDFYNVKYEFIKNLKEDTIRALNKVNPKAWEELKDAHYNDYLAKLVKYEYTNDHIDVEDGEFVQVIDPVYMYLPESKTHTWRYPFFVSEKYLFGVKLETYWFNAIVLWFMTLMLFLTLYFEVFVKIGVLIDKLRRPKFD